MKNISLGTVIAGVPLALVLLGTSCRPPTSTSESHRAPSAADRAAGDRSDRSDRDEDGKPVPPGTELDAESFETMLRESTTRWVVVQLFQETCAPCLTEALRLNDLLDKWKSRGITVVGCGIDPTPDETRGFAENTGGRLRFPLYHAPWLADRVGVEATPTLLLYDRTGTLRGKFDPDRTDGDLLEAVEQAVNR